MVIQNRKPTKRLRKGGRPRLAGREGDQGKAPLIALRLPQSILDAIQARAEAEGTSRSDLIRRYVEAGLKADTQEKVVKAKPKPGKAHGK